MQGGMGAALLSKPETAHEVSSNDSIAIYSNELTPATDFNQISQ